MLTNTIELPQTQTPERAIAAELLRSPPGLAKVGSELLVVGDADHVQGICTALRHVSEAVYHVPSVQAAIERGGRRVKALILVSPLPEATLKDAVVRLSFAGPVFVVVPEGFSDRRARALYDLGTAAVFEWPSEALLMPRMLQQRLRLTARHRGSGADGDEALARSIRTRLEMARPTLPPLEIVVHDGVVELEGRIDSIWKKDRVSRMIEHVPGVRAVLTDAVQVVPPHRPDSDIDRDIRGILEIMLGKQLKTVSFSVDDGAVVLVGNVADRDDIERLLSFIGNVRGVKVIRNLVTISASANRRDRGLTRRLSAALRSIYPDSRLKVVCFGPVAVVSGRVPRISTKREVIDLIERQDGIERVVDKIEVREVCEG